jgi:hypothetical protein
MAAGKALLLGVVAVGALVAFAFAGGSAHAEPEKPSPGPDGPFPSPAPGAPVPTTKGLSVEALAQLASDDVRVHGWYSGRGVVRAFQIAYNATSGMTPIKVDDKWGPQTSTAAHLSGVASPAPAYFSGGKNKP